jgi:hypothetical protein
VVNDPVVQATFSNIVLGNVERLHELEIARQRFNVVIAGRHHRTCITAKRHARWRA